ncbi:MAG: PQQ-binding-like beta-propeller repeat protein [Natrialbaceae archaeon]|nr:PQQ-binding-like beta-propeller repeat protein [Natrialbaceae archaeon]
MRLTRRTVVQSVIGGLGLAQQISQSNGEWRYDYNQAYRLPTVYDGVAYVVGGNGSLHAIDIDSASREWIYDKWYADLGHEVAVVDGRCFVSHTGIADNTSAIRMFDAETGETRGSLPVVLEKPDVDPGPPLVHDGICYVQTTEALIAIDYLNKEMLWSDERCSRPSRIFRATIPAIQGDIVVSQSGRAVHAFDALTGEYQWTAPYEPSIDSRAPVIEDGEVYLSLNGGLVCVDLATGEMKWRYRSGAIGYLPAQMPVIHGETAILNGGRVRYLSEGVVEAIDISGDEPSRRWRVNHGSNMSGVGTIADGTVFIGADEALLAIDIETGEKEIIASDGAFDNSYRSTLLAAGHLFLDMKTLTAIEFEDPEDEYGSRGYHASNAHHDGWAERAALKVASLELDTTPVAPRIGDELEISVTAQLESGIEANVTDDSTLEVNSVGSVDENGTVRIQDSGEMALSVAYGGETTNTTIAVPEAEETDDESDDAPDDAVPGGGIITAATAIGGTAYWLSRMSGTGSRP